ncbi:unnamed protein product [Merluccius merluccius]
MGCHRARQADKLLRASRREPAWSQPHRSAIATRSSQMRDRDKMSGEEPVPHSWLMLADAGCWLLAALEVSGE